MTRPTTPLWVLILSLRPVLYWPLDDKPHVLCISRENGETVVYIDGNQQ